MTEPSQSFIEAGGRVERVLGHVRANEPGPMLMVLGGIHGNEPAGVAAARRVLACLQSRSVPMRGEFVALVGNLGALEKRTRFVEKDLNRQWLRDKLAEMRRSRREDLTCPDDLEQFDLLRVAERLVRSAEGSVYFLDLHTFSAPGSPFVTVGDTLCNRRFARKFPLPLILGLEEQVDGAFLEHLNNLGVVTAGVEGGQHDDPASVDHLEAVIWVALAAVRILSPGQVPDLERFRSRLQRSSRGLPRVVEVRHRHAIHSGDGFRMEPGFASFKPVHAGRIIARDSSGDIRAEEPGMVLLPLYQGKGEDGFFVAREVSRFWLWASYVLRRLRVGRLVPLLPGVRWHPERAETLIVDTRVARVLPMDILHLLGYRKVRREGDLLLVERRRFDLVTPDSSERSRLMTAV